MGEASDSPGRGFLGASFFRKVLFHISSFEANELGSLASELFDLGPFTDFRRTVFRRV